MLRGCACAALVLLAACAAPVARAQSSSNTSCPPFLSNYTSTISNISIFTSFLETYESVGLDTDPSSGFAAFAPTDKAWGRVEQILTSSVGGNESDNDVTPEEADILLTVGLYHLTGRARTAEQFLAKGSAQTLLGDLTGYNVSLYFEMINDQIQVEGIPFGNAAPIDTPDTVCSTTVYIIDEVMQPTSSLAETPGFTQLISAAQAPASAPVPISDIFSLPLAPGPGISVTTTGPGSSISTTSPSSATDINGDNVATATAPTDNVAAPVTAPAPQAAARDLPGGGWCAVLAGLVAAVVATQTL